MCFVSKNNYLDPPVIIAGTSVLPDADTRTYSNSICGGDLKASGINGHVAAVTLNNGPWSVDFTYNWSSRKRDK